MTADLYQVRAFEEQEAQILIKSIRIVPLATNDFANFVGEKCLQNRLLSLSKMIILRIESLVLRYTKILRFSVYSTDWKQLSNYSKRYRN
jgi:hypothetical protein